MKVAVIYTYAYVVLVICNFYVTALPVVIGSQPKFFSHCCRI